MNPFESIDDMLYHSADGEVVRRRKNPLLPLLVGIAGGALAVWSLHASSLAERPDLSSMLMLLGGIAALAGLIKAAMNIASSEPVFGPTGERIRRVELFYDAADKHALCDAVRAADAEALSRIPRTGASGAVLMTVYATGSGTFAMAQVAEYIPHAFEPVTEAVRFDTEQGRSVAAVI